jgi:predicted phosphoribosyltransferase
LRLRLGRLAAGGLQRCDGKGDDHRHHGLQCGSEDIRRTDDRNGRQPSWPIDRAARRRYAAKSDTRMQFHDRIDAGRRLAARLEQFARQPDVVVLGLPRGGIPVANEVAARLGAPLDVFLVRKLGVPGHPELAMGAIAEGGVEVLSRDLIRELGVPDALVERVAVRERLELERRDVLFRGNRLAVPLRDRTVILVDDGLATGSTMKAAVLSIRQRGPKRIIVAVPVGARETCQSLRQSADEVVCVAMPEPFNAVGLWYEDFSQTSDEEVRRLLESGDNHFVKS